MMTVLANFSLFHYVERPVLYLGARRRDACSEEISAVYVQLRFWKAYVRMTEVRFRYK